MIRRVFATAVKQLSYTVYPRNERGKSNPGQSAGGKYYRAVYPRLPAVPAALCGPLRAFPLWVAFLPVLQNIVATAFGGAEVQADGTRDFIAKVLHTSTTQIGRYDAIIRNLCPAFKAEFRLPLSVRRSPAWNRNFLPTAQGQRR